MPRQFGPVTIGKNHDYDFTVDGTGNITAFVVVAEVNYGTVGMTERIDIWSSLSPAQKVTAQNLYNAVKNLVDAQLT